MTVLAQTNQPEWDPSQFQVQPDGSFKISIIAMAAMAGIDRGALSRSLKSADAENALPCARSLVAQGFEPDAVSTWGATGGIPEAAAPFILEHYGITASSPSDQARAVLLSFSRVGINAYLKDRLGILNAASQPQAPALPKRDTLETVEFSMKLLERLGGIDDRSELMLKDIVLNYTARQAGGEAGVTLLPQVQMMSLAEAFQELGEATPSEASKLAAKHGRAVKALYRDENGRPPKTHKQLVNGRNCDVCDYEVSWLMTQVDDLKQAVLEFGS